MKSQKNTAPVFWKIFIACLLLSAFLIMPAQAEEERYVFERMWPTLQQPWYFTYSEDVAVDKNGNFYVLDVDIKNSRIRKFGSDGSFISKWGISESFSLSLITVDGNGFVYVVDRYQIKKFDSNGMFK